MTAAQELDGMLCWMGKGKIHIAAEKKSEMPEEVLLLNQWPVRWRNHAPCRLGRCSGDPLK